MMEKKINKLTLHFPHGASVEMCELIAQRISGVVRAGISEGGFDLVEGSMWDDGPKKWSDDSLCFIYGHNREIPLQ